MSLVQFSPGFGTPVGTAAALISDRRVRRALYSGGVSAARAARQLWASVTPTKRARSDQASISDVRETGGYVNSGNVGRRIPKPKKKRGASKYEKFGSLGQDETYANISKPSIAYIGAMSAKATGSGTEASSAASWSGSVKYHVAAALLRDILKREWGVDITRHDQIIPIDGGGSGMNSAQIIGGQIFFVYESRPLDPTINELPSYGSYRVALSGTSDAVNAPKAFCTCALEIAQNVIGGNNFGGVYGTAEFVTNRIYGYVPVKEYYDTDATSYVVRPDSSGLRRLDERYMKCYSTMELMLQNCTVADTTVGTNDTQYLENRIDSNPVDCALFKFSTPLPIPRQDGAIFSPGAAGATTLDVIQYPTGTANADAATQLGKDRNPDGVINPLGNQTRSWVQLPIPSMFKNCTGYTKFKLGPGEIRKIKLPFRFEGKLHNFIQGMATISETKSQRYNGPNALGTSVLVAAEKIMSTGTSTNVSLNYQVSYWAGCYFKKPRGQVIQPYNATMTHTLGTAGTAGGTGGGIAIGTYTGGVDS